MTPEKSGNLSNIFFRINDNQSNTPDMIRSKVGDENNVFVRAEEITLVLLILALWMVAIGLFVQRWGKIRMLEPYQPEYKHINEPSFSLNPMTSPTHAQASSSAPQGQRASISTCRLIPRKSSSLCFTPAMLQTDRRFSAWTLNVPHISSQTYNGLSSTPRASPRMTGRCSDAHVYKDVIQSTLCQKARSAENLCQTIIIDSASKSEECIDMSRREVDTKEYQFEELPSTSQQKSRTNYY